jgi:adenylate cyclase
MRSALITAFLLLAAYEATLAQNILTKARTDSLLTVWKDPARADSARALAFKEYIWKGYLYSDPDSAIVLAEELIVFGNKQGYVKAQALGHITMGVAFNVKGNIPKALESYVQSLRIYEGLGDKKGIATALNNIGNIYWKKGDHAKALEFHTRSLRLKEQLDDQKGIALSLNNIGLIHNEQGDDQKALDHYARGLKIQERLGADKSLANTLNNIGNVYVHQGEHDRALDFYTRCQQICEQLGDRQGIANALENIGQSHLILGDHQKALEYYFQALNIREQLGDKEIANTLNNIGEIYRIQGVRPKALNYCQRGYDLAVTAGVLLDQKHACECLYNTYKAMGRSDEALLYHERLTAVDDSLFNEENTKRITRLDMQYEFDKKEAVAQAEQDKKDAIAAEQIRRKDQQRNAFIGGFVLMLGLAAVSYQSYQNKKKANTIITQEKARSEALLHNILPRHTIKEMLRDGKIAPKHFDSVSVLFTDFQGFTEVASEMTPDELIRQLNICFSAFDRIVEKHGLEKIKTIGDSYMAASGIPITSETHAIDCVKAALDMAKAMKAIGGRSFRIRIGIHSGPVVAGIVGTKKFQYDIWGDTVNTASRMESSGEVGRVNISEATYQLVKGHFHCEYRGEIEAKGKGKMGMWFVSP